MINDKHRLELWKYLNEIGGTIHIHAPYCINLAKKQDFQPQDEDLKGLPEKKQEKMKKDWSTYCKSITSLTEILHCIQGLPMTTVIHPGADGSLEKIVEHINMMQEDGRIHQGGAGVKQQLLLEVAAEKGRFASSWEDLAYLFGPNGVDKEYVGLCLDTAHLFGAGMCDFASYDSVDMLFGQCDSLGASIGLIHLNDSAAPFASRKDKHMAYLRGYIWKGKVNILTYFMHQCFDRGIDIVSESSPQCDMFIMEAIHNVYIGKACPLRHNDPYLETYVQCEYRNDFSVHKE
jgi:endonuclease IV